MAEIFEADFRNIFYKAAISSGIRTLCFCLAIQNSYPMTMPGNPTYRSKGCQSNLQQITHRKASSAPKFPRISIGLLRLVRCNWIDPVQEVRLFGVRQIFGLIWASQVPRIPICSLYLVEYNWGDRVQEARPAASSADFCTTSKYI